MTGPCHKIGGVSAVVRGVLAVLIVAASTIASARPSEGQPADEQISGPVVLSDYAIVGMGHTPSGFYAFDEESGFLAAWVNDNKDKKATLRFFRPEFFDEQRDAVIGPIVLPNRIMTAVLARQSGALTFVFTIDTHEVLAIRPEDPDLGVKTILKSEEGGTGVYAMDDRSRVLVSAEDGVEEVTRLVNLDTNSVELSIPAIRAFPSAVTPDLSTMVRLINSQAAFYVRGAGGPDRWRLISKVDGVTDYILCASIPRTVLGPFGRYAAIGRMAREMGVVFEPVAEIPFVALASSSYRPLLVGMEGTVLNVASANTFELLASLDLNGWIRQLPHAVVLSMDRTSVSETLLPRTFVDGPRDRVIVVGLRLPTSEEEADDVQSGATRKANLLNGRIMKLEYNCRAVAIVAPLNGIGRAEPFVGRYIDGARCCLVGREMRLTLRTHKSGPSGSVELVSAPEGMKLDGESMVWTPRQADVGQHEMTIRTTSGSVSVDQSLIVWVEASP